MVRAPEENLTLKIGSGKGVPYNSVLSPCIYIDGIGEGRCKEWKRALPVPKGS